MMDIFRIPSTTTWLHRVSERANGVYSLSLQTIHPPVLSLFFCLFFFLLLLHHLFGPGTRHPRRHIFPINISFSWEGSRENDPPGSRSPADPGSILIERTNVSGERSSLMGSVCLALNGVWTRSDTLHPHSTPIRTH